MAEINSSERLRQAVAILEGHRDLLAKGAKSLATKGHEQDAAVLSEIAEALREPESILIVESGIEFGKSQVDRRRYPEPADDGTVWPSWNDLTVAIAKWRDIQTDSARHSD